MCWGGEFSTGTLWIFQPELTEGSSRRGWVEFLLSLAAVNRCRLTAAAVDSLTVERQSLSTELTDSVVCEEQKPSS